LKEKLTGRLCSFLSPPLRPRKIDASLVLLDRPSCLACPFLKLANLSSAIEDADDEDDEDNEDDGEGEEGNGSEIGKQMGETNLWLADEDIPLILFYSLAEKLCLFELMDAILDVQIMKDHKFFTAPDARYAQAVYRHTSPNVPVSKVCNKGNVLLPCEECWGHGA
jgi:hypothetical protein